jgi:NAD dependent epimerase/dehydratase family enzyme
VLRLALGEEADLLLHGQRAVSRRLEGFAFAFPSLRPALEDAFAPGASA